MDKILILDFGSQTTQLIARRIRDMGVYTEIIPGDTPLTGNIINADVKGIILSGSPESVNDAGAVPDKKVYDCVRAGGETMPLLGICYGLQRMTHDLGGKVESLPHVEYGRINVKTREQGAESKGQLTESWGFIEIYCCHGVIMAFFGDNYKITLNNVKSTLLDSRFIYKIR